MGTEVLLPRDLFADRFRGPSFNRRRNLPANGNLTNVVVNRRPHNNNHNKKTSPKKRSVDAKKPNKKDDATTTTTAGTGSTPMGKVTLLRRGESLDSLTSKIKGANPNPNPKSPIRKPIDDLAVTGTGRIGPESPEMVPKQIRHVKVKSQPADVYAGSAFFTSPSPKSVPLPSFFSKKIEIEKPFDDSATRDLRRLLRLE